MAKKSTPECFVAASFEDIKAQMEALGTYRPEFDTVIQVYVDLLEQYRVIQDRLVSTRYTMQTKSAQGGFKRSPVVAAHEAVRKDILAYSDRLCLNPKALSGTDVPSTSVDPLVEALRACGG